VDRLDSDGSANICESSPGPAGGCFAGHERQGSYRGKDCSARTRRNQARGLSHHRLLHGLLGVHGTFGLTAAAPPQDCNTEMRPRGPEFIAMKPRYSDYVLPARYSAFRPVAAIMGIPKDRRLECLR
jgi:hypothetical protein